MYVTFDSPFFLAARQIRLYQLVFIRYHQRMNENLPCNDKLRFDTQAEANAAALLAQHQHNSKLKSYKCRHCSLWHLASKYE